MRYLICFWLLVISGSAFAEDGELNFILSNKTSRVLSVAIYNQDRPEAVHPAPNKHYDVEPSKRSNLKTGCNVGERLCFYAWWPDRSKTWGAGPNSKPGRDGKESGCSVCKRQDEHYSWQWDVNEQ